jgi:hypothetical protein
MPDVDRLLRTLERASQAFCETPGRTGHFVQLTGASDVAVVGDLHGHVDNFRRILMAADLAKHPNRHLVLQELIHGPFCYPIGGDKSHQLVDLLAALKCQYPQRVHLLLGNHELAQWTGHWIAKDDVDVNEHFRIGVSNAYGTRADEVYAGYLQLFAEVPVAIRTSNRVLLSHSMPASKRMSEFNLGAILRDDWQQTDLVRGGSAYALVWGRDTDLKTATEFLSKMDADWLITGHITCDTGYEVPNERQIILDAKGSPAAYCLFPADRAVTQQDLLDGLTLLP